MTEKLESLIVGIAKLDRPRYSADCAIARYCGVVWPVDGGDPPRYTSSIDAALTLIPDGWAVSIYIEADSADAIMLSPKKRDAEASHKLPAIALVLAALRARLEDMK